MKENRPRFGPTYLTILDLSYGSLKRKHIRPFSLGSFGFLSKQEKNLSKIVGPRAKPKKETKTEKIGGRKRSINGKSYPFKSQLASEFDHKSKKICLYTALDQYNRTFQEPSLLFYIYSDLITKLIL